MRGDLIDDYEATHDPIESTREAWLYRPTRAEQWAGVVVQTLGLMCGLSVAASLLAAAYYDVPGWVICEALRAAQARKERSITARVRAWRERLREARAAARDAASALMPFSGTEAGDRLQRPSLRMNPGEERAGSGTFTRAKSARGETR